MEEVIGVGPYIGSFKEEIINFLPYCRWIVKNYKDQKVYVSSHHDRNFLYDFILEDRFFRVVTELSRKDSCQEEHRHTDISQEDYKILVKRFTNNIKGKEPKAIIKILNLGYSRRKVHYDMDERIYKPIKVEKNKSLKVVFIPQNSEKENVIKHLYSKIKDMYDVLVMDGPECYQLEDCHCYSPDQWKEYVETICSAKVVVCPVGFWTFLCNLQGVKVVSWGEGISPYKTDNIFSFGNQPLVFPTDESTSSEKIIKTVSYYLENLNGKDRVLER